MEILIRKKYLGVYLPFWFINDKGILKRTQELTYSEKNRIRRYISNKRKEYE